MFRQLIRPMRQLPRSTLASALRMPFCPMMSPLTSFSPVSPLRHNSSNDKTATLKMDQPQLMIAFTCNKCDTRSSHTFSKQAYSKGTVLIQCPGCKNRHLIADNLKIFRDNKVNLEDILKAKGESVATTTDDLAFEDIPESLRSTLGHHAKDAPEEYQKEPVNTDLPEPKK